MVRFDASNHLFPLALAASSVSKDAAIVGVVSQSVNACRASLPRHRGERRKSYHGSSQSQAEKLTCVSISFSHRYLRQSLVNRVTPNGSVLNYMIYAETFVLLLKGHGILRRKYSVSPGVLS